MYIQGVYGAIAIVWRVYQNVPWTTLKVVEHLAFVIFTTLWQDLINIFILPAKLLTETKYYYVLPIYGQTKNPLYWGDTIFVITIMIMRYKLCYTLIGNTCPVYVMLLSRKETLMWKFSLKTLNTDKHLTRIVFSYCKCFLFYRIYSWFNCFFRNTHQLAICLFLCRQFPGQMMPS